MTELDYSQTKILQLSNDAFFYLRDGEEPLDETNLQEAEEIKALFPQGFEIKGLWAEIPGTGRIEATFVPYVPKEDNDYDMESELAKGYFWRLKFTRGNRWVRVSAYRLSSGETREMGEYELKISPTAKAKTGNVCFATGDYHNGKGCLSWLKHYTEKNPGAIIIPIDSLRTL